MYLHETAILELQKRGEVLNPKPRRIYLNQYGQQVSDKHFCKDCNRWYIDYPHEIAEIDPCDIPF